MKIWICIPVFNRIAYTLKCLANLDEQTFHNFTIVICDHGSTDGTTPAIQQNFPDVVVINAENTLWWTGAINRCLTYVLANAQDSDVILTLNNDVELPVDYLQSLLISYQKQPHSIITSVIHDIQNGKLISPGYRFNWYTAKATPIDYLTQHVADDEDMAEVNFASGRGTLIPVAAFKELGLFDEMHLPHYLADYDFTFKAARHGYRIFVSRHCKVFSYVQETGMTKVLTNFSLKSFIAYFWNIRSPANLRHRFWYGLNNCPKWYLPMYFCIDFIRVFGGYFKKMLFA